MKNVLMFTLVIAMASLIFAGCNTNKAKKSTADQDQAKKTAQAMKDANAQTGMPAIKNWQEKKLAKMLYELRDQTKIVCYYYFQDIEGRPIYMGKCIGYGLPYCVQYSNPERIAHDCWNSFGTIPQPEPNGLFMPMTLSATWLMMINPKTGNPEPIYVEPEIIVNPFPLPYADYSMGKPKEI